MGGAGPDSGSKRSETEEVTKTGKTGDANSQEVWQKLPGDMLEKAREKYDPPEYEVKEIRPQEFLVGFFSEGRLRQFEVHVPKRNKPGKQELDTRLILHGANGGPANGLMQNITEMNTQSEIKDFLAVYPLASNHKGGDLFSWNADNTLSGKSDPSYDDVKYIKEVLKIIHKEWNGKQDNLTVVGFSDGGMFAHQLVNKLDGKIDNLVTVCGSIADSLPVGKHPPKKVMTILAGSDPYTLPTGGGSGLLSMPLESQLGNLNISSPLRQAAHYIDTNKTLPLQTEPSLGVHELLYTNWKNGNQVKTVFLPVVEPKNLTGNHGWPGSKVSWPVIGEAYADYNATQAIEDFLSGKSFGKGPTLIRRQEP